MARKQQAAIEWVGGLISIPGFVTGESKPFRPEALLWIGANGEVLAHAVDAPGALLDRAADHLRRTIERPMYGKPRAPTRVRVASPELADVLRAGHPGIEIVCAPTPEIDAVARTMREDMAQNAETEASYLSPEASPEAIGALFRASAALFRAKPWQLVPSDQSLIAVTIEQLDIREAVVSVIGQRGQSLGFILFSGLDDFLAYLEMADAAERGEAPPAPPHFALSFERGADLAPTLRREVLEHGWEVADADAYPWPVAIESDLIARPPTTKELSIAEAIARALTHVAAEQQALTAAWDGGEAVTRTLRVATHAGELDVTLRVPYEPVTDRAELPDDVIGALRALEQDGDEMDEAALGELADELESRFAASLEAEALPGMGVCRLVMDFATGYIGVTIASVDAHQLREILFEIIPRKLSVDASEAGAIIDELRAFYLFLKREFALDQADACLRVLAGNAVDKLRAALSDASKFGMAKSMVMAGQQAGFDLSSPQGLEAWMREAQARPLPASLPLRAAPRRAAKHVDPRAKKKKQKEQRKARKKSR